MKRRASRGRESADDIREIHTEYTKITEADRRISVQINREIREELRKLYEGRRAARAASLRHSLRV